MIGTERAKDTLYTHLNVLSPGPGYSHFPKRSEYDEEYFKQIFAEEPRYRMRNGRRVRVYVTRRKRNEKLDLRVMNLVALELADPRYVLINEALQPEEPKLQEEAPAKPLSVMIGRKKRKASFVNRWRG